MNPAGNGERACGPRSLADWLRWQGRLSPHEMELGLERVAEVASRLLCGQTPPRIITVAGTNGKGSCVALAESILTAGGYRVGSYTSPHILTYNERIRVAGRSVSDQALCGAFEKVESAREGVGLTYFEFGTLAALWIFCQNHLDVAILEVGLGGRLDAVNIQDPDLVLIPSIGIDHTHWLGPDREAIGREKAGVMRSAIPAVCGDVDPPRSLIRHARSLDAPLYRMGVEFGYARYAGGRWAWWGVGGDWPGLPPPGIVGSMQIANAATVLQGLLLLSTSLPLDREAVTRGLRRSRIMGRFQCIDGAVQTVLDVAHNPDAVRALARTLEDWPVTGRTLAVFSVLADKNADGMIELLRDRISRWYVAPVQAPRALPEPALAERLSAWVEPRCVERFDSLVQAYRAARNEAQEGDRVLVFGSAVAVGEILAELDEA